MMLRKIIGIFLALGLVQSCIGQISNKEITDLKVQLLAAKHDSTRGRLFFQLAYGYRFSNIDSSLLYSNQAIEYAEKYNLLHIKAQMLSLKGATVLEVGKLPESLQFQFEAIKIAEKLKDTSAIAFALNRIGNIYMELADYEKSREYYNKSKDLFQAIGDTGMFHNEVSNIGNLYYLMQKPDSALYYQQIVYDASLKTSNRVDYTRPEIMFRMGNAFRLKEDSEQALVFYKRGIVEAIIDNDIRNLTMNNLFIAQLYYELGVPDSSLKYAYDAIKTSKIVSFRKGVFDASVLLSNLFKEKKEYDSAFIYLTSANIEKDSLTGNSRFQDLQRIVLNEQELQRNTEAKRIALQNRQKQHVLIAAMAVFLVIASILYRNNKNKQKANIKLENTLQSLRSTQAQLIQSEKMASLGELTAGIAHEIQNPLNFVNNFSEVNKELIEEVKSERSKEKSERDEGLEGELLDDIAQNLEKINHHGKRADAIVKGMLQHSRTSTGQNELTDINALCDEYLRLAYHGLKAKDPTFNVSFHFEPDEKLPKLNVVPQDIGRVLLNLINNAFQACGNDEFRRMRRPELVEGNGELRPQVIVAIKNYGHKIEISVKDNGPGIPENIKDKIFQPFFTTKPTGQGTGLGLSLSYDIVKAHGGELKVETKEGEGSEFIIILPLTT